MNNITKYRDSENNWLSFGRETIKAIHGDMYYYRDLYDGKHHEIFPRAQHLIKRGEIVDVYADDRSGTPTNIRTPYIMLNISKIIADIPSMFVSRSIGQFKTNHGIQSVTQNKMIDEHKTKDNVTDVTEGTQDETNDIDTNIQDNMKESQNSTQNTTDAAMYETTESDDINGEVIDPQQAIIDQIIYNSHISHTMNITQLQVDGGIVAVPSLRNEQISIDFKERNVYYPHEDDMGVDLVYELPQTADEETNNVSYVHVYTERQEGQYVQTVDKLYVRNGENEMSLVEDPTILEEKLKLGGGFTNGELVKTFMGRQRPFVSYLANNPTFMNKLGNSSLKGLDGKQEEVNWTLTRTAQTFERNGKPRISIPASTMDTLKAVAQNKYGDENKIDHELLEVTEIDQTTGKSIEIHQIDTAKIGDMSYVQDIVRAMLAETQTSENAVEFVKQNSSTPQSGTAKFYDLIVSIIKSEQIRDEYVEFLKDAVESALWIANKKDPSIIIERPNVMLKDMLPQPKQELSTDNIAKYNSGVQSLEETVRGNNPDKSEQWVQEEIKRIEDGKSGSDTMTQDRGTLNLQQFMDNKDVDGNPLDEDGNLVNTDGQTKPNSTNE
ncbi:hypothetical protein [Staphylococcus sp. LKG3-3]|uniref:hypothetical protein n=1 Tax=Staphylococcus sp. LKG3-3 TaxID=3399685 RepID=UPI003D5C0191